MDCTPCDIVHIPVPSSRVFDPSFFSPVGSLLFSFLFASSYQTIGSLFLIYYLHLLVGARLTMESKQTDLWAVVFITFAAATIITAMRLLSRRLKRIPLSWDDYFALCGYVSFSLPPR